jgi:hypothetical protein
MTRPLAALALCAALTGCASLPQAASSKETFALCQAVDAVTTYAIVSKGGTELNPLMAGLMKHGWLPFVGFKAALVWMVYHFQPAPNVQVAFNVAACAPIPYNLGNL